MPVPSPTPAPGPVHSSIARSATGTSTTPPDPPPLWQIHRVPGPLLSTAIHAGHALRGEVAELLTLPEDERLREEDSYTDAFLPTTGSRILVHRSRFEVDLNRPRDGAVYRCPEDAWGLELWPEGELDDGVVERSLELYDAFYRDLRHVLEERVERWGGVALFDVHSYNHRREGPDGPAADPEDNPDVNVGTGNIDRERWAPVVEALMGELAGHRVLGRRLDVRENVRFRGGHLSRWTAAEFPDTVCPLAIELKKIYMDEWTGRPDPGAVTEIRAALTAAVPAVLGALDRVVGVAGTRGRG